MKIGLYGLHRGRNTEPEVLAERARRAEAAGFESIWVGDHLALPADAPDSADEPRLEALSALTFLAGVTTSVQLGVGVLVLPQRQPVLLAKQLTSLDRLSRGRLQVGVAVGYVQAELAAFGVALDERVERTEEYLAAMRALWRHDPSFSGRYVTYRDVSQQPAPQRAGGPPVIFGGHVRAALDRAARLGDGWFGWGLSPQDAAAHIARIHALRHQHGRDREPFEITVVPDDPRRPDAIAAYTDAGVDRLIVVAATTPDDRTEDAIDLGAALAAG